VQDIHFELWKSFRIFDGRASLRTWVYRIAHNTGASHMMKHKRGARRTYKTIEDIKELPDGSDMAAEFERADQRGQLMALITCLKPTDRQLITLYLEGMNAAEIGEIAGITSGAAATKIHRLKSKLSKLFNTGHSHDKR
jgi:RNA polymerase sigma-70 factor (ECF subfamily)